MPNEFEDRLSAGERELETALRALKPAVDVDAIACAYAAGAASGNRSLRAWRAAAAVLAVAFGTVAITSAKHASPIDSRPIAATPHTPLIELEPRDRHPSDIPAATMMVSESRDANAPDGYLQLRDKLLNHGLDAFPPTSASHSQSNEPVRAGDFNWRPL